MGLFYLSRDQSRRGAQTTLRERTSQKQVTVGTGSLTSVLVFLGALVSSLSLSEISSLRPCLLAFGVEVSSTRAFCEGERESLSSVS